MENEPKLGGWLSDPPDDSDYIMQNNIGLFSSLPEYSSSNDSVDLRKWCSPIENQRDVGSCVGNAVVGGLELLRIKNGEAHKDLSRLFVYYNARLMHNSVDRDEGTFIRIAMATLSSIGTCTEEKWKYDTTKVFVRPSWGAYREAYANKIGSFYKIDGRGQSRVDAIKSALKSGHPIAFGCLVTRDFQILTGADGVVRVPDENSKFLGGHAMLIVGYLDGGNTLVVRNSWGPSWGKGGYCYMPSSYLDASSACDLWVPTAYIKNI